MTFPAEIETVIEPSVGAVVVVEAIVVVGAVVEVLDGAVVVVEVEVDVVVVVPDDEKIQLPRPEQRSKPTRHGAPLLPDVMSRNVMLDP